MGFWELAMTVAFLSTALTLSVLPGPHAHVRADHPELEAVASAAVERGAERPPAPAAPPAPNPGDETQLGDPAVERAALGEAVAGRGGPAAEDQGRLKLLTYNVAGLLDPISKSTPSRNHLLISPRLNSYDLVLVQEGFHYFGRLSGAAAHQYRLKPKADPRPVLEGDGLGRFSNFPLRRTERQRWDRCSGVFSLFNDCLAAKGFEVSEAEVGPGVWIDVYNLHLDAGEDPLDQIARGEQIDQLIAVMNRRSADRPVVVAGDTNLDTAFPYDAFVLERLMERTGLRDACRQVGCQDERIDRVLARGGGGVELRAVDWYVPTEFVDGAGAPLSDHDPVAVELVWRSHGGDGLAALSDPLGADLPLSPGARVLESSRGRAALAATRARILGVGELVQGLQGDALRQLAGRLGWGAGLPVGMLSAMVGRQAALLSAAWPTSLSSGDGIKGALAEPLRGLIDAHRGDGPQLEP